ncbi:MAG: hypothetical protein ABI541_01285 [Betaproteobacteria bacterium]
MADIVLDYKVTAPMLRRFHNSPAFFRGVRGPFGSGKTTAMILELAIRAGMQKPGPDGIRRTRFAVVRNTAPELLSTTIKSFVQWYPEGSGKFSFDSPITFTMKRGDVHAEYIFLALDLADDVRKLLSLELTGCYINEAREVLKEIVDAISGRVGRFPPMRDGGPTWSGVIADTNAPDTTHWWYILAERDDSTEYGRRLIESTEAAEAQLRAEGLLRPDQRLFEWFAQPSGRSPEAEGLEHLQPGYYTRLMAGKDDDWIRVYVDGQYGYLVEGRAVFSNYHDSMHLAPTRLEAMRGLPLLIGADWGLTPAAVIGQRLADGQWLLLDELVMTDTGIVRFAELLTAYVGQHYPNFEVEGWGDPAGQARAQTDERTVFDIMKVHTPWRWRPAPSNDIAMRLEGVRNALSRLIDGKPGLVVSPKCVALRRALAGGYRYKQQRSGIGITYSESPEKNESSHVSDAVQYLLAGGGEGAIVMGRAAMSRRRGLRPTHAVMEYRSLGE